MRKKVLLISNHGGGFYNFKRELVSELLKLGYEVHFAVPPNEKLERLVMEGAVHHEISIDRRGINPVKDLDLINQFRRLIKGIKPDIILSHTIKPNIYASILARNQGIPYLNNITGLGSALQNNSKLAGLLRFLYRYALSDSSGIFFENEGNRRYFQQYNIGKEENYIVVSGAGVNLDEFSPKYKIETDESGSQEKEIIFIFIGRIMKDKGIEEFLGAAEYIKRSNPATRFQIVGFYDEQEYSDKIDSLVKQNIIEFLGPSTDTRVEMSQADCIVLPSYHEGMSNVLLEGAAMGLPLITTDIHGCKEAVDDGKNGFLCKVKDTESLIDAMERFIALSAEERRQMGLHGREKMLKEFDRKLVIGQYIKVIQSVIGEAQ